MQVEESSEFHFGELIEVDHNQENNNEVYDLHTVETRPGLAQ